MERSVDQRSSGLGRDLTPFGLDVFRVGAEDIVSEVRVLQLAQSTPEFRSASAQGQ